MSLLFIMGVAYLLQTNSFSTRGYEIKDLQGQLTELKDQNEKLEMEARTLKAIETIEAETRTMNLVPAGNSQHLGPQDSVSYQR